MKHLDEAGNGLIVKKGIITLVLAKGKRRRRKIGQIDDLSKTLVVKRNRMKHLFRQANSYGFNYHVLSNAKRFDKVLLIDDYGQYLLPIAYIFTHGSFLHFKEQGFERQIFLPLEHCERLKQQPINQINNEEDSVF